VRAFCDEFDIGFSASKENPISENPISIKIEFKGYSICSAELRITRIGMVCDTLFQQLDDDINLEGEYADLFSLLIAGVKNKNANLYIRLAKLEYRRVDFGVIEDEPEKTDDGRPMIMSLIIGKEGILHKKCAKNICGEDLHYSRAFSIMLTKHMSPRAIIEQAMEKLVAPAISDFVNLLSKKPFLIDESNPISQVYRQYEGNMLFDDEKDGRPRCHHLKVSVYSGGNIEYDRDLCVDNWQLHEDSVLLDSSLVDPTTLAISISEHKLHSIVESMTDNFVSTLNDDQDNWIYAGMLVALDRNVNISGFTVEISICGDPADFADSKDYDPRYQEECDNGFRREAIYLFDKHKEPMLRYTWVE
jgi:hypothetical protein